MIFVSFWFILFISVFFPVYWLVPWSKARMLVLVVACVVFHFHFAGPAGALPIIVLGTITYFIGLSRNRTLLILGMLLSAASLVFYKYTIFLTTQVVGAISPELGTALQQSAASVLPLAPPLAISFFVFEFIHYLYDVQHGQPPIKNPLHFTLFAIFWPSLVAGPIKRYQLFVGQLMKADLRATPDQVASGMVRVASGLVKKGLADNLTIWINHQAPQFATLDMEWRWFFFVALALRIYWDFSGYSDMAIGFARMMGIGLPENFNWPYLAVSIGDFWRRWHISLSSWIRDYVYIPLGGSRYGVPRRIANSIIVFAICGLWHGADWNFLVWGLFHGIGLAIQGTYVGALGRVGVGISGVFQRFRPLSIIVTFLYVGIGWFFFFYPVQQALTMLRLLLPAALR